MIRNNVIPFPMHRVRRSDPTSLLIAIAEASFVNSLNVLRLMYDLPPLQAKGRSK